MNRLARFVVRRRKLVLIGAAVVMVAAGALGGKVADHLSNGGFSDPGTESSRAERVLDDQFATGDPNLALVVTARSGQVDDEDTRAAGAAVLERLAAAPHVQGAASYWSLGSLPPLRSHDGSRALVFARIAGTDDEVSERIEPVLAAIESAGGDAVEVRATGQAAVYHELTGTSEEDLKRAEIISLPIVLLLLILVFGSVVAASLPLAVTAFAVVGTFAALRIVVLFTDVSVFSLNLTTGLGLGLAIDYSLLVLTRYREELARGTEPFAAVERAVQTGGRTVVFSACTVAASLSALLVFPFYYLRSFAYAGIIVVVLSAVSATVILPALLAVLGRNVDRLALWRRPVRPAGTGFWHRLATGVMRRPLPVAAAIIALLLLLGAPFAGVHFGQPDDRMLPPSASTRQASDQIREGFDANESNTLAVVAPDAGDPAGLTTELDAYAKDLSSFDGVNRVDAFTGSYVDGEQLAPHVPAIHGRFSHPDGTWLSVVPDATVDPQSSAGEQLARAVRAAPAPFDVAVGGPSARLIDSKASLTRLVPFALGIIAVVTFVTLFLLFGSILVPLKAVVLNLLSLTATFGAMVWIFQDGNGSGLLDFTATGNLEVTTPILMFCIAFGLSMDYEVFLLSRISEAHREGHDNTTSVALGLERTGGIVTAAAALMGIVFLAFGFSDVAFLKLFGVGLTMAVLVDATLIRGLLVPAFMRLAGDANWWAPAPLRRFHDRFGISESPPPVVMTSDTYLRPVPGLKWLEHSKEALP